MASVASIQAHEAWGSFHLNPFNCIFCFLSPPTVAYWTPYHPRMKRTRCPLRQFPCNFSEQSSEISLVIRGCKRNGQDRTLKYLFYNMMTDANKWQTHLRLAYLYTYTLAKCRNLGAHTQGSVFILAQLLLLISLRCISCKSILVSSFPNQF